MKVVHFILFSHNKKPLTMLKEANEFFRILIQIVVKFKLHNKASKLKKFFIRFKNHKKPKKN